MEDAGTPANVDARVGHGMVVVVPGVALHRAPALVVLVAAALGVDVGHGHREGAQHRALRVVRVVAPAG